jgi:hypothetical protein
MGAEPHGFPELVRAELIRASESDAGAAAGGVPDLDRLRVNNSSQMAA